MRVLFVFELGSPIESLDYLRQCANSLRNVHENVEVHLALKGEVGKADVSWADKMYSTPTFKTKSEYPVSGFWKFLHLTGWSDPQLRKVACSIWASIFRMVKPDYVFAVGSPSALLVASIEGIKAIQVGNGQFIPSISSWGDECPFPELESWLFLITRHTAQRLLTHPAIIFSNRAADEERNVPGFNVFDDVTKPDGISMDIDVLALWDQRHPLSERMRKLCKETWGSRFVEMSTEDFRVKGYDELSINQSKPLIIGNYDPLSVGIAIKHDLAYIGSPLNKLQLAVAEKCENKRICYRLDDQLMMLKSFAQEPYVLQGHAMARGEAGVKATANLDSVLSMLVR